MLVLDPTLDDPEFHATGTLALTEMIRDSDHSVEHLGAGRRAAMELIHRLVYRTYIHQEYDFDSQEREYAIRTVYEVHHNALRADTLLSKTLTDAVQHIPAEVQYYDSYRADFPDDVLTVYWGYYERNMMATRHLFDEYFVEDWGVLHSSPGGEDIRYRTLFFDYIAQDWNLYRMLQGKQRSRSVRRLAARTMKAFLPYRDMAGNMVELASYAYLSKMDVLNTYLMAVFEHLLSWQKADRDRGVARVIFFDWLNMLLTSFVVDATRQAAAVYRLTDLPESWQIGLVAQYLPDVDTVVTAVDNMEKLVMTLPTVTPNTYPVEE